MAEYEVTSVDGNYVEGKVYVIYDGAYATMILCRRILKRK